RQAGQLGRAELTRVADLVNEGLTEMRGATAPRLLLELICARVLLPGASDDPASLLARVERLERRLSASGAPAPAAPPQPAAQPARRPEPAPKPTPEPAAVSMPERPQPPRATVDEPAAARASEPAPEPEQPAASRPAAPQPAAAQPPGAVDAAGLRRLWDDVLEATKKLRRTTHALLLSGPAQVVDVKGNVLVLGFTTGPLERQFKLGNANEDTLREALREVLGSDWRIETTLAGGGAASPAAPAPPASPPSAPPVARPAAPAPQSSPAVAASTTSDFPDEPDFDDDDADDGASGLALLQRHLGATVINDAEAEG
ncbi:MAG TPA: DNA polymerase III subunit gamma/tau, partial [Acidothermaceae bacterium]|nr:DNA polymerase III subunit gamma/tau [Acidothermaceae bacterium]